MGLKEMIPLGISLVALCLSIINYRKSLKMHNENFIYTKKFDVYLGLLGFLGEYLNELEVFLKSKLTVQSDADDYALMNKLYEKRKDCEVFVNKNGLLIDQSIAIDVINVMDTNFFILNDYEEAVIDVILTNVYSKSNSVMSSIAKELAINDLNHSLKYRLKVKSS